MIAVAALLQAALASSYVFPATGGWVYVTSTDGRDLFVKPRSARRTGRYADVEVAESYPTNHVTDMRGIRRREHFDCLKRLMMADVRSGPIITFGGELIQPSSSQEFLRVDGPIETSLLKTACAGGR